MKRTLLRSGWHFLQANYELQVKRPACDPKNPNQETSMKIKTNVKAGNAAAKTTASESCSFNYSSIKVTYKP
jgi:hypothetical protein